MGQIAIAAGWGLLCWRAARLLGSRSALRMAPASATARRVR
jgi:hypothetical protein